MDYEWDPAKARTNQRKHRIDFADEQALTLPDDEHLSEDRYITIGLDALGRLLWLSILGVVIGFG